MAELAFAVGANAQPAQITITDHLSAGQVEETLAVFLAGQLAGTLNVDASHPDDAFTAGVSGERVGYALCGLLRRQQAGGTVTNHRIDNGGTLLVRPGGYYAALTLNDVTFGLTDEDGGRDIIPGPACTAVVS